MKKIYSLLLIFPILQASQTNPDQSFEQQQVVIPSCVIEHRTKIATLNEQLHNQDLADLIHDIAEGHTTFGTLYRSVQVSAHSLQDAPDLQQLDEELTGMYRRKKCCCISTLSTLTVTGTLKAGSISATGNITTTGGVLIVGGVQILAGTGSPNGSVTAPQGSLYLRKDGSSTSTRAYINTDGSTTWTAITTVA